MGQPICALPDRIEPAKAWRGRTSIGGRRIPIPEAVSNLSWQSILRGLVALIVIGATSAAFVISFAAIVYNGPLAPYLGPGLGLALFGAVLMGLAGAAFFTYRGTVCQPQDINVILLASTVSALVAEQNGGNTADLWPTVLAVVITAPLAVGLITYLAGCLRVGLLARVIPYPVIGGFLAASGYMLISGALSMTIGENLGDGGLSTLTVPGLMVNWVPWLGAGLAMLALARLTGSKLIMPLGLIVITGAFYLALELTGTTLEAAREAGYMLGPFQQDGLLPRGVPQLLTQADWSAVLAQAPAYLAISGLTILGVFLNSTGTEMALDRELDIGKDLRATGISNFAGGLGGGLPGFQILGQTLFASRLGLTGPAAGLSAASGAALVLILGGSFLEYLPAGLFAAVISFLGFDLLIQWIWYERRRLSFGDYGIVWLILVSAAVIGFLVFPT